MSETWHTFQVFSDLASAQAVAGRLQIEGVPAQVNTTEALSAVQSGFELLVPGSMMHRARWVLAQVELTGAELSFLATGKLGDDAE